MLRPAKAARSRRHGSDHRPRAPSEALCGSIYTASPRPSPSQAAGKGVTIRTCTERAPFMTCMGNEGNHPRAQILRRSERGHALALTRGTQRALVRSGARTLRLLLCPQPALVQIRDEKLGWSGRVGRRRVALQRREPAPIAKFRKAASHSPDCRAEGGS